MLRHRLELKDTTAKLITKSRLMNALSNPRTVWQRLLVCLCAINLQSVNCHAQAKLEEGETVKVLYLNSWFDGVVLGKDKNRYGVEFEFANTRKRELFDRSKLRKLCEVDALDFARMWESNNGKFKIEAALKSYSSDKILLAKTDGSEVSVTVSNLSPKDVAYLTKFKKNLTEAASKGAAPAPVPKLPPLESFGSSDAVAAGIAFGQGRVSSLGGLPAFYKDFQEGGVGFLFARSGQEVVAVIPVGGPEQLVLLTAREDNFHNRGVNFQSQAYWVSLKQQKVLGSVALTPEDYIVDYDPRSKLLLSVHQDQYTKEEPDFVTVWNLKPGATEAEPSVRWNAKLSPRFPSNFAKILNNELVLVKSESQTYVAWNFVKKNIEYSFKSASFFDAPIVVSSDRRSLLLPEDGKVTVLDSATGTVRFSLPVDDRHVSGVNVDPSGTRLAALTESNVYVWDLASAQPKAKVYAATLIGSPFQSRIEWVDEDSILAESQMERVLYRLSLELPVWSYRMNVSQYWLNRDPLTNVVLNGLFFYIAQPQRFNGSIAVGAVKLPGPKVDELTKGVDKSTLLLMKPGVSVGIKPGSVSDPAQVERWLREKIDANGWVFDRAAAIQFHASMGVGETQNQTYKEFGGGGRTTTVSFTPHFATLELKMGDTIVWQTGTSTGAPPIISGNDLQSSVAKSQVPQLEFFRSVLVPAEIIDPKYSRGFGVSILGLRGIEVESTSPPGREGDPTAAERKMVEDQAKDFKSLRQ
jgi:SLA1 homology domain 1, SHD1